jgi:hypothetical protein
MQIPVRRARHFPLAVAALCAAFATAPAGASAEPPEQTVTVQFPNTFATVTAQYYDPRNLVCARLEGARGTAYVTALGLVSSASGQWQYAATAIDDYGGDKTCARVPASWEDHAASFRITYQSSGGTQKTVDYRSTINFTF